MLSISEASLRWRAEILRLRLRMTMLKLFSELVQEGGTDRLMFVVFGFINAGGRVLCRPRLLPKAMPSSGQAGRGED